MSQDFWSIFITSNYQIHLLNPVISAGRSKTGTDRSLIGFFPILDQVELYNHRHGKWTKLKVQLTWGQDAFVIEPILHENGMANANGESSYWHLTDVQITKCLALTNDGMNQRAIATKIGCGKSTVGRLINRYRFETFAQHTRSKGPAFKTSKSDDSHLTLTAKRNFDQPLQDITNLSGLPISRYTTWRRLKEVNLQSHYAKRKAFLSSKYKQGRLE